MPLTSSMKVTTRFSDLDSLRHVNNRIYERICSEGRYNLLGDQGYTIESLLDKQISLRPLATFVRFSKQQKAGEVLNVRTDAYPRRDGVILWDHHIHQSDGELVCHLQARTRTTQQNSNHPELMKVTEEGPERILIEEIPAFSGNCPRVKSLYKPIYTDMDFFGDLPIAAWWRLFEEGRHMSGEHLGLTLRRFLEFDTHIFWVSGTYQFYRPVTAGQELIIHTWLERIVGIRAYIRQEIRSEDSSRLLGASREEHLIVSLEKARPKAMPSELAEALQEYVEYE
jgi:acyl-CoA thioesterase FadM